MTSFTKGRESAMDRTRLFAGSRETNKMQVIRILAAVLAILGKIQVKTELFRRFSINNN